MGRRSGNPLYALACCACVAIISIPIMLYFGFDYMAQFRETTEEQCTVVAVTRESCTYDCNCYTSNNKRRCNTCQGVEFDYIAMAQKKCEFKPLQSGLDSCNENMFTVPVYNVNQTLKCYIPDCDRELWYSSKSSVIALAVGLLAGSGLIVCCLCMCAIIVLTKTGACKGKDLPFWTPWSSSSSANNNNNNSFQSPAVDNEEMMALSPPAGQSNMPFPHGQNIMPFSAQQSQVVGVVQPHGQTAPAPYGMPPPAYDQAAPSAYGGQAPPPGAGYGQGYAPAPTGAYPDTSKPGY